MNYTDFVYFDIETSGNYPDLLSLKNNDMRGYDLFMRKIERKSGQFIDWKLDPDKVYLEKTPLMPEFGRVVCVSIGYIKDDNIKIESFINENEEDIIFKVHKIFEKISNKTLYGLSGFYIKGFDIPFLNRKFMQYGLTIPKLFKSFGVKPWEMNILDLAEVWKSYGTLENVSLDEMLYVLGIDSPKSVMAGKDVHNKFWNTKDYEDIKTYCEGDVVSCIKAAEKIVKLL